jgi:hypothetical protein
MKKYGCYLLALLAIALAASGCSQLQNLEVRLNEEFSLAIGQQAHITGENLEVGFKEVIEDSRCPKDVTCFWTGRVSCVIELVHTGSSYRMVLTEPGLTEEYTKERYEGYEICFHMTPYPEAGKKIAKDAYRLHLIISKLPELTKIIGSIIAEPLAFEGQEMTIVGYYRGWDLFHEANMAPPVTRSDWVIKDATGALYISADSEAKVPEELHPDSLQDTGITLKVKGVVRVTEEGQAYIEAKTIERLP